MRAVQFVIQDMPVVPFTRRFVIDRITQSKEEKVFEEGELEERVRNRGRSVRGGD